MSLPRDLIERDRGLGDWAILTTWRGSIAHGMHVPQDNPDSIDDKDVMSVCVPSIDHYLGLRQYGSRGTREVKRDEWDIVVYEARKAIGMLAQGNPNVLSLLWVEPNHIISQTDEGAYLREQRDVFVGRHVFKAFSGYAYSQVSKLQRGAYQGYMGARRKALVDRFGYDPKTAAHAIRLLRMGIEFLRDGELVVLRPDAAQLLEIKRGEWTLAQVKAEADRLFGRMDYACDHSALPARPDARKVNDICVSLVTWALTRRGEIL